MADLQPEDWRKDAACKDQPTDWFVLKQGQTPAKAAPFCAVCPVRQPCYDYAVRSKSVGVWGGHLFSIRFSEATELTPIQTLLDMRPVNIDTGAHEGTPSILMALRRTEQGGHQESVG